MAKDPAINWYFDNWAGGTKGFSRHQKGCYMDLLESQFYLGHLSLDQVKNILGADFNQWNVLKGKFAQDEHGNFFNERLELEKNKRVKYSESRSRNRAKKDMNNISKTHEKDVRYIPETGTEIDIEKGKGGTGEREPSSAFGGADTVRKWTLELPGWVRRTAEMCRVSEDEARDFVEAFILEWEHSGKISKYPLATVKAVMIQDLRKRAENKKTTPQPVKVGSDLGGQTWKRHEQR